MDFLQDKVVERLEREKRADEVALFGCGVLETIYTHLVDTKAISGNDGTDLVELEVAMEAFSDVYRNMSKSNKLMVIKDAKEKRRWQEIAGTEDPELSMDDTFFSENPSRFTDEALKDKFEGAILVGSHGEKVKIRGIELEHKNIPDPERWTKAG